MEIPNTPKNPLRGLKESKAAPRFELGKNSKKARFRAIFVALVIQNRGVRDRLPYHSPTTIRKSALASWAS